MKIRILILTWLFPFCLNGQESVATIHDTFRYPANIEALTNEFIWKHEIKIDSLSLATWKPEDGPQIFVHPVLTYHANLGDLTNKLYDKSKGINYGDLHPWESLLSDSFALIIPEQYKGYVAYWDEIDKPERLLTQKAYLFSPLIPTAEQHYYYFIPAYFRIFVHGDIDYNRAWHRMMASIEYIKWDRNEKKFIEYSNSGLDLIGELDNRLKQAYFNYRNK